MTSSFEIFPETSFTGDKTQETKSKLDETMSDFIFPLKLQF